MLISEHIAFLERQLAEHGDVEILKMDNEWGVIPFAYAPLEYRCLANDPAISGGINVISLAEYELSWIDIQNHSDNLAAMNQMLEEAKTNPQTSEFAYSHQEMLDCYLRGYHRDLAIVQAWPVSPKVLVL